MHFLNRKKAHFQEAALGKPRAAVLVRFDPSLKALVLVEDEALFVLRADALLAALPEDVHVLSPEGKRIEATGAFHVTTETFDPLHAVTDVF